VNFPNTAGLEQNEGKVTNFNFWVNCLFKLLAAVHLTATGVTNNFLNSTQSLFNFLSANKMIAINAMISEESLESRMKNEILYVV